MTLPHSTAAAPAQTTMPAVRASERPDAIDTLVAARLSEPALERWRQWLEAPRLRLLGAHRAQYRRGLLGLTPESIGIDPNPATASPDANMSIAKVAVLAVSDHGCLLHHAAHGSSDLFDLLVRNRDDTALEHLAGTGSDAQMWTALETRLYLGNLQAASPPVGEAQLLGGTEPWTVHANSILAQAAEQGQLTADEHAAALDAIRCREDALRLDALAWLAEALEADCLEMLAQHGELFTCATYNWLASVAPAQRRNRVQALGAAPFLLDALIHGCGCDCDSAPLTRVNRAVDQGLPLTPVLADVLGLRESDVRRLRPIAHARCAREGAFDGLRHALDRLQCLPPEHWPRDHEDMQAALQRLYLCDWFAEVVGYHIPGASARLWQADGAATRQFRHFARRGWQHPVPRDSSGQAIYEINDMLQALVLAAAHADDPAAAHDPCAAKRVSLPETLHPLAEWSYPKWRRLARRWHSALHQVAAQFPYPDNFRWPPLVPPLTVGKRRIVFLTTPAALEEEGRLMQHCVAERVEDCLSGEAHVASVCDLDGRRRSTLQLVLSQLSRTWRAQVQEHLGPRNQAPHPECSEAANVLLHHISDPATQPRLAWLQSRNAAAAEQMADWEHRGLPQRARRNRAAFELALPGLLMTPDRTPESGGHAAAVLAQNTR